MSRRHRAEKRDVIPDAKYGDEVLTKFMNSLMLHGKKSTAERILYGALDAIEGKLSREPVSVFHEALENIMPAVEVRSRRVGGATYQVPVEVRTDRKQALAIRWLITAARARGENTMVDRLAGELMDAVNNRGTAVKKARRHASHGRSQPRFFPLSLVTFSRGPSHGTPNFTE
jgi:small subunit ribosomal protein S7